MNEGIDRSRIPGLISAVLSPFFIALGVMVAKKAGHSGAAPFIITAGSALISLPFLLCMQNPRRTKADLAILFGTMRRPFLQLLLSRSLIGSAMVVVGFTMTTAIKSVLLLRVEALFVFFWSVYFKKEKASISKILLLLALVLGSVMVVMSSGSAVLSPALAAQEGLNWGDGLIVMALLFLSYSYIPTEELVSAVSPTSVNITANAVSGAFILVAMLIASPHDVFSLSHQALKYITEYALTFSVVGVNLYYFAFKTIKPWIVASFLSLEVIYGVPLAWYMHGETLDLLQTLGAGLVMAATAGIGLLGARASKRAAAHG
jgi:drug/metabolite transporter (DMT)-like permease